MPDKYRSEMPAQRRTFAAKKYTAEKLKLSKFYVKNTLNIKIISYDSEVSRQSAYFASA